MVTPDEGGSLRVFACPSPIGEEPELSTGVGLSVTGRHGKEQTTMGSLGLKSWRLDIMTLV